MKKLFVWLSALFIALILFSLSALHTSADTPTYIQNTDPTAAQIISEVCSAGSVNYYDWDYYITASNPVTNDGVTSRYFALSLVDPESKSDIHILNENYDVNHVAYPFKIYSELSENKRVLFAVFEIRDYLDDDETHDIDIRYSYYDFYNNFPNTFEQGFVDAPLFYASNMSVFVGDSDINKTLYTCDIFYTADTESINYQINNKTDDTTLGFLYGIREYQTINGGDVIPDNTSFKTMDALAFLQWCTANKLDYNNYVAFIDVYRGIEFLGSYTVNVGDIIDGGDDFYDHELPLPEAPDYSDYIDNPPNMPIMPDLPEMPNFDPEHPIDSVVEFIKWLGHLLLTPLIYIGTLLGWIIETIGYYLGGLLHYLLDLFSWLIECLGVFVYNLVVKLKGLLYRLFVPRGPFLDNLIVTHFPFIHDLKHIITDITFSGATGFSLTLLDNTYYFSFIDTFGSSFCITVSALVSVYVDCVCIFTCYKAIKGLLNFAQ